MIYRHSKKAGNEGDVIKHISLIAALDTIMKSWNKDKGNKDKVFSYCDTYAANGLNLLKSGLGWTKGIDRIQSQMNHTDLTIIIMSLIGKILGGFLLRKQKESIMLVFIRVLHYL